MNTRILVILAYTVMVISFIVSFVTCDFSWFARSGSFMTAVAVLLSSRAAIRQAGIANGFRNEPSDLEKELSEDRNAFSFGFSFLAVGALIWGYGDLLNICLSR
ncbi:hypothetical protein J3R74_001980 [Puniceicoccus vermicola]